MTKRKYSLDALKSAFEDNKKGGNSSGGRYFNFFNMDFDDTCTVRFLPDLDEKNPKQFTVEKKVHRLPINGETENVPCLTMYGDHCPMCDVAKSFYDEGNEDQGKIFYRKLSHIAQVLVKKDPINYDNDESCEGQVKAISMGYQIFGLLRAGLSDLDTVPFDFEEGTDFQITKSKKGKWADYNLGTKFVRKESALTAEELEVIEEGMMDLKTLLPEKPKLEVVEAKLAAALTGSVYEEDEEADDDEDAPRPSKKTSSASKKLAAALAEEAGDDDDEEEEEVVVAKPARKKKVEVVVEEDEEEDEEEDDDTDSDDDDDDDGEGNKVLARIRARREAAKKG